MYVLRGVFNYSDKKQILKLVLYGTEKIKIYFIDNLIFRNISIIKQFFISICFLHWTHIWKLFWSTTIFFLDIAKKYFGGE